ncbi:MAG: response regulator [Pseudomonas sp.]|nr:response regulator [Pseudomonas sp.]
MNKVALIVDDSRVSRLMLGSMLKTEDPEWQVVEAANGLEALSKAAECQPSLITLDINMP